MPLTGPPRQTGPAFLRELATHYSRSPKPAAREAAGRLRAIALELEELQVMSEGVTRATPPVRDLTPGTETALARLREAAKAPPPTPEQMAELRALRRELAPKVGT